MSNPDFMMFSLLPREMKILVELKNLIKLPLATQVKTKVEINRQNLSSFIRLTKLTKQKLAEIIQDDKVEEGVDESEQAIYFIYNEKEFYNGAEFTKLMKNFRASAEFVLTAKIGKPKIEKQVQVPQKVTNNFLNQNNQEPGLKNIPLLNSTNNLFVPSQPCPPANRQYPEINHYDNISDIYKGAPNQIKFYPPKQNMFEFQVPDSVNQSYADVPSRASPRHIYHINGKNPHFYNNHQDFSKQNTERQMVNQIWASSSKANFNEGQILQSNANINYGYQERVSKQFPPNFNIDNQFQFPSQGNQQLKKVPKIQEMISQFEEKILTKVSDVIDENLSTLILSENFSRDQPKEREELSLEDTVVHTEARCSVCEITPVIGKLYIEYKKKTQYCEKCAIQSDYGKDFAFIVRLTQNARIPSSQKEKIEDQPTFKPTNEKQGGNSLKFSPPMNSNIADVNQENHLELNQKKPQEIPVSIPDQEMIQAKSFKSSLLNAALASEIETITCEPGQNVELTINLTNTGKFTWPAHTKLHRVFKDQDIGDPEIYELPCKSIESGKKVGIKVAFKAPTYLGEHFVIYQLKEKQDIGEIISVSLNVVEPQLPEQLIKYQANIVQQKPDKVINTKTDQLVQLKIKFRNIGENKWPHETNLYQVSKPFQNVFLEGEEQFQGCGECKPQGFKMIDFEIKAPSNPGQFTIDFQLGLSQQGPFFGPILNFNLLVE